MKEIECTRFEPNNTPPFKVKYTIRKIIYDLSPELQRINLIPPRKIVNELLAKGRQIFRNNDGYTWEPIEINQEEFEDFIKSYQQSKKYEYFKFIEPENWVENQEDLMIWGINRQLQNPSEKLIETYLKIKEIKKNRNTLNENDINQKQISHEINRLNQQIFTLMKENTKLI